MLRWRTRNLREKPGLDTDAAAQRIHVEDRQALWKQAAEFAAVEGHEDRARERKLHGPLLHHVHLIVPERAGFDGAVAPVPLGRAGCEATLHVLGHRLVFDPAR